MIRRQRVAAAAATAAASAILVAGSLVLVPGAAIAAPTIDGSGTDGSSAIEGTPYPGDAAQESLLIASEERRLVDVRSIANAAEWTNVNSGRPYRLVTGSTYTLVLIERDSPYTLDDIIELAPRTFVRQPDGSYLLSENIVVEQGATLRLESADGLVVHLASSGSSFVSITTIGGSLEIEGTPTEPVQISSWDAAESTVDTETSDGRSYIRVTGGHADFANVEFSHLGFWSGATGGVSLTGTEIPEVISDAAEQKPQDDETGDITSVYGSELYPVTGDGDLQTLSLTPELDGFSYVSATIQNVVSHDNAFGMFITSADGVDIRDSSFRDNLVDGLVFHRYVINTIVRGVEASDNGMDGFSLTRATTGILLDRVTSSDNSRNGITLEGGPLAEGPSATGTPVGSYGNNSVTNSTITDNKRYGIEVVGGSKIFLDGNAISGHVMGIVVTKGVDKVTVTDNVVEGSQEQGIALRNGVTGALVQGNAVQGGEIGIYLRDAGGVIDRNTVESVTNHAVTVIAQSEETTITSNQIDGSGPSAVDTSRAGGDVTVSDNDTDGWQSTKPLDVILRSIFQPLTVMWLLLGLIVLITAVSSIGRRRSGLRHPYADQRPLSELTSGVVSPESLGLRPAGAGDTAVAAATAGDDDRQSRSKDELVGAA